MVDVYLQHRIRSGRPAIWTEAQTQTRRFMMDATKAGVSAKTKAGVSAKPRQDNDVLKPGPQLRGYTSNNLASWSFLNCYLFYYI